MNSKIKIDKKVNAILQKLVPIYWDEHVHSGKPFEVLISTIISQRTRDEQTYKASRKLLSRYGTPEKIVKAGEDKVAELIKNTGFYRQKARRIVNVSKILIEKYGGAVPSTIEELLSLPGVGRKTANCVLVYGFGKDALPVDTHVHRIANRIGLVRTDTPEETENELKKIIPKSQWKKVNLTLVRFGQSICKPLKPACHLCPIRDVCEYGNDEKSQNYIK